jgi:hypothetical protein
MTAIASRAQPGWTTVALAQVGTVALAQVGTVALAQVGTVALAQVATVSTATATVAVADAPTGGLVMTAHNGAHSPA